MSPLRNKIRHQLVPLLESYNPRVNEALLQTARIAGEDHSALDRQITGFWGKIIQRQGEAIVFDKEGFLVLSSSQQRHLLRGAIEELTGSLKNIEAKHVDEMITTADKQAGKRINLPGRLIFIVEYGRCLLIQDTTVLSPFPLIKEEHPLTIPGETLLSGWQVIASIVKPDQVLKNRDDFTAYLDFDKTGDRLTVRRRQAGDRFQPLGMSQSKKLAEFMIDAKIPRSWRRQVPVVASPEHPVWVVGWRIDDRVKVSESTRRVLSLQFERY